MQYPEIIYPYTAFTDGANLHRVRPAVCRTRVTAVRAPVVGLGMVMPVSPAVAVVVMVMTMVASASTATMMMVVMVLLLTGGVMLLPQLLLLMLMVLHRLRCWLLLFQAVHLHQIVYV